MNTATDKALRKALKTSWMITKLILPIYVLVDVLNYLNVLAFVAVIFRPLASVLGLPPEAALALAGGGFFNLYIGIALAAPLGLSAHQWTVMAVFMGFFHSILIETAVLSKLDIPRYFSGLSRLAAAFVAGYTVHLMPAQWFGQALAASASTVTHYDSFTAMLVGSVTGATLLTAKIVALIAVLIVSFDLTKSTQSFGHFIAKADVMFRMAAGVILGVTYGAGLLITEEQGTGTVETQKKIMIGSFLMMAHGLIEETLLFTMFGASSLAIVAARILFGLAVLPLSWLLMKNFGGIPELSDMWRKRPESVADMSHKGA